MSDRAEYPGNLEQEATLVICSDDPEVVEDRIVALTYLGGFGISHRDALAIRDLYFDSRSRALGKEGWALRIRQVEGDWFIALKGRSRFTEWGGLERQELELPWSGKAWDTVMGRIPSSVSPRPGRADGMDLTDPVAAMQAAGFDLIQKRTTHRRPRDVRNSDSGRIVAEMVVDSVVYQISSIRIDHSEVEIEAKAPDAAQQIERIVSALLERYGNALLPWKLGKLATGLAIKEILARETVEGLIVNGRLTRAAYERIRAVDSHARR